MLYVNYCGSEPGLGKTHVTHICLISYVTLYAIIYHYMLLYLFLTVYNPFGESLKAAEPTSSHES